MGIRDYRRRERESDRPTPQRRRRIERAFMRGDTIEFPVTVWAVAPPNRGLPIPQDVTTWTMFWMTAKFDVADPDVNAVFQVTSTTSPGITVVSAPQGSLLIAVPPSATVYMPDSASWLYYDVQGKDAAGNIWTVERGVLKVIPDVTRAIV